MNGPFVDPLAAFDPTIPHHVVHTHTEHCTACGSGIIRMATYLAATTRGQRVLTPVYKLPLRARVIRVNVPDRPVATCPECIDVFIEDTMTDAEAYSRWQVTLRKHEKEAAEAAKAPKKPAERQPATLEELA